MAQLRLAIGSTWGGRRKKAGRKRVRPFRGVPHVTRPYHERAHPLHLTWRVAAAVVSLRRTRVARVIEGAIGRASGERFRVLHYSIQPDHLHMVAEANDRAALMRGARSLAVRLACAINRALGRRGQVFTDRYHARPLGTPLEVRRAIAYVLLNASKHVPHERGLDRCSSGRWFSGWKQPVLRAIGPAPVARPTTWLAGTGWWKRHGLISLYEAPRGSPW